METATTISTAVKFVQSAESVEALADKIVEVAGPLDRERYLAVISEWKARYASVSADVRKARIDRKGDRSGYHQARRQGLRIDARHLMALRTALKEIARRHHLSTRVSA